MSEQLIDYNLYPSESAYGYRPTEWVAITFIVIFSLLATVHVVQGAIFKYWIVYPTLVLGIIGACSALTCALSGNSDSSQARSLDGQGDSGPTAISTSTRLS
jgi:hypothetical protein